MAVQSRLTLEEFLRREETKPASEYACGEVFQKPMPTRAHSAIQIFLGAMLYSFLSRTRLGDAFTEFRCIFGPPGQERTYVPDLVFVARERLTTDPYLHVAPDLAIEIVSPDHHRVQLLSKVQFYLLHGVRMVWIVDPENRTVGVATPGADILTLSAGETLDGGEVLPGFTLAVDEIFAGPRR